MAAQHVHQVFPQTLAATKNLGMAGAGETSDMGDLLLLFQEAQERHSHA
jgi:hypothetical protein